MSCDLIYELIKGEGRVNIHRLLQRSSEAYKLPKLHPASFEIKPFQSLTRKPLVLSLLLAAFSMGSTAFGQDALISPQLRITAPEAQPIIVAIRYFDAGDALQTEIERIVRPTAATPLKLDGFHDGIHIVVQSPTSNNITLELLEEDEVIVTQVVKGPGQFSLRYGSAPPDDQITLPAFLPTATEKRTIIAFIRALNSGRLVELVSEQEFSNIDAPTLNAFTTSLTETFGAAHLETASLETEDLETKNLDGWIAWNGSIGARILVGKVKLERRYCQFKLVLGGGKLIDVEPYSPRLTNDWYSLDIVPQAYRRDAEDLIEAILSGNISAARAAFSARYRDDITPEAIQQLHQRLRTALGESSVKSTELSYHELSTYSEEARGCSLKIHLITTLENGKKCVGTVDFFIPSAATLIGKAHLRSIELYETWPSAYPAQATITQQLLNALGIGSIPSDNKPEIAPAISNEGFTELLNAIHPDVIRCTSKNALKQFFDSSRAAIASALALGAHQSMATELPDMDLWTFQTSPVQVAVNGRVPMENNSIDLKLIFVQQQLVGCTIRTPFYSASTLDLLDVSTSAQQLGTRFWTALLSGDTVAAHQLLAPEFQEQLPLELFQEIYEKSALVSLPTVKSVQVDTLRLSDNPERAEPVMLAGYYVAEFTEGESFQPLRCDFRLPDATEPTETTNNTETGAAVEAPVDLLNFSTDFETAFPSHSTATTDTANKFLNAFANGTSRDVVSLIRPSKRETVETEILDAFLRELQTVLNETPDVSKQRMDHVYQIGTREERLRMRIPVKPIGDFTEEWIDVEATFEFGFLETFQFRHTALEHFVDRLGTNTQLAKRLEQFFSTWLSDDVDALEQLTSPEMQTPVLKNRLRLLRNELRVELGPFQSAELMSLAPDQGTNEFTARCKLQFQNGAREATLLVECDALSSRIYSVSVGSKTEE